VNRRPFSTRSPSQGPRVCRLFTATPGGQNVEQEGGGMSAVISNVGFPCHILRGSVEMNLNNTPFFLLVPVTIVASTMASVW